MEDSRILIVEDDAELTYLLDTYFTAQNYTVHTAAWGEEGVRLSREENFQLVILDIRLPDIDGYEVCRQIRLNRKTQEVPIIFLTERNQRNDKLHGLELGVVDYITKPFDMQELHLRIRNTIQRAAQYSLMHSITELPDVVLSDQNIGQWLYKDEAWAALAISIRGLDQLRELHGFVAADELLRALTLIIRRAMRESGRENDFVGHFTAESFIILSTPERIHTMRKRVEQRVLHSLSYFYQSEELRTTPQENFLTLDTGVIDSTQNAFDTIEDFRSKVSALISPNEYHN